MQSQHFTFLSAMRGMSLAAMVRRNTGGQMLASIIITDADEASARVRALPAQSFIALDFRCSTGGARAASVCISPAVARQLRAVLNGALDDLDAAQRAAPHDTEASETEASHASP
jgi:hypothetical protein